MGKIKVLLAEDHVVVREGTRELLQHEPDIKVIGEAGDGEEAIEIHAGIFCTNFPGGAPGSDHWPDCKIEVAAPNGAIIKTEVGSWITIGPSIAVWLDPNRSDHSLIATMTDGAGNVCVTSLNQQCESTNCCEEEDYVAVSIDDDNTPDTIAAGGNITVDGAGNNVNLTEAHFPLTSNGSE